MQNKAFTLVEMLVALAVGAIVIMATYASYEMVATQYKKNIDVANMHTSGRAIMQMIERDVRMAGFEYRHTSGTNKGKKTFSSGITTPLNIKDSGNKCCDEVTVVYDHAQDVLDWKGRVVSNKVERIRVRYWAEIHLSNKGNRYRLYKQKDILGQNQKILTGPKLGSKEVMADYIEDLQINKNGSSDGYLYILSGHGFSGGQFPHGGIYKVDVATGGIIDKITVPSDVCTHKVYGGLRHDPPNAIAIKDNYLYISYDTRHQAGRCTKIAELDLITGRYRAIELGHHADGMTYNPKDGFLYLGVYNSGFGAIDTRDFTTRKMMPQSNYGRYGPRTNSIAIGPNGYLYTGRSDGPYVDIWDISTKNLKKVGEIRSYQPSSTLTTTALAFDNKGNLYSGNYNGVGVGKTWLKPGPWRRFKYDYYYPKSFSKGGTGMTFSSGSVKDDFLVAINLTLRTKNQYGKDRQFKKKDYQGGNFKIDKTDKYKRDTFSTTVLVRNLAL